MITNPSLSDCMIPPRTSQKSAGYVPMNLDFPHILDLFPEHRDPKRSDSASFLIWYLENYYRLDPEEAVDYVCDQSGDKGIDGLYVNDNMQTIHVFQSRISQKTDGTTGDVRLKEFAGTLYQLNNSDSVAKLIQSAGEAQVAKLLERLNVAEKVNEYELHGEYLCNNNIDHNGRSFLQQTGNITFVGRDALIDTYISDERDVPVSTEAVFDIADFQITEYTVDAGSKALIVPVRATDLLNLDGIKNQGVFIHNVRGPLGSTKVNRDITKSIKNPSLHKKFPLFHNGITIIAGKIETTKDRLVLSDYFVVNGCQSLTAFSTNAPSLTDNLYVLAKFIMVEPTSLLAKQITEFSNNQNGVKARDFKANSSPQIRLQNEFQASYPNEYQYSIKRGESTGDAVVISNEDAGLYLLAFDLKEPWATPRKYQVFDDKHSAIFGRKEVTADRILMLHIVREEIDSRLKNSIQNTLVGKYVLTRYLMMYVVREVLENDEIGQRVIKWPKEFVRSVDMRNRFRLCVRKLLQDVAIDLNAEVKELGDDFDYRGRLRDEKWVKELRKTLVSDYQKQVARDRIPSFTSDWESQE